MDEKELLQYYKLKGDLSVLGKLYAPYMSLLYGVCYKYLQDPDQSQDAVMDIFDELIEKLRVHEVINFKSWLYVYARNYCLMQLRKGKQMQKVPIEEHLYESEKQLSSQDPSQWQEQDFERLNTCIDGLSSNQQRSIRMFYLKKMCYNDIADELGIDHNQVKSNIQNGRRNLKICMERSNGK